MPGLRRQRHVRGLGRPGRGAGEPPGHPARRPGPADRATQSDYPHGGLARRSSGVGSARLRDPGGAGRAAAWASSTRRGTVGLKRVGGPENDPGRRVRRGRGPVHASASRRRRSARLQHPNIVQIHEVGEHEGRPYFCAGVRRGRQPAPKLARPTPCPPRQAARAGARRWRAPSTHAHQRGIVHRDLKPANILLTADGAAQDRRLRPGQAARRRRPA